MSAIGLIERASAEQDAFAEPLAVLDALSSGGLTDGEPINAALLDVACVAIEALAIDGGSSAAYRALTGCAGDKRNGVVN